MDFLDFKSVLLSDNPRKEYTKEVQDDLDAATIKLIRELDVAFSDFIETDGFEVNEKTNKSLKRAENFCRDLIDAGFMSDVKTKHLLKFFDGDKPVLAIYIKDRFIYTIRKEEYIGIDNSDK